MKMRLSSDSESLLLPRIFRPERKAEYGIDILVLSSCQ